MSIYQINHVSYSRQPSIVSRITHTQMKSPGRVEHINISAVKMASPSTANIIRICTSSTEKHSMRSPYTDKTSISGFTQKGLSALQKLQQSSIDLSPNSTAWISEPVSNEKEGFIKGLVSSTHQQFLHRMSEQLRVQNEYWSAQCEKLRLEINYFRQIVRENQVVTEMHKIKISQLNEKTSRKDQRLIEKTQKLERELASFRTYYQQCYQYTFKRIEDVQLRIGSIQEQLGSSRSFMEHLGLIAKEIKRKIIEFACTHYLKGLQFKMSVSDTITELQEEFSVFDQRLDLINLQTSNVIESKIKSEVLHDQLAFWKQALGSWESSYQRYKPQNDIISDIRGSQYYQNKIEEVYHRISLLKNEVLKFWTNKVNSTEFQQVQCQQFLESKVQCMASLEMESHSGLQFQAGQLVRSQILGRRQQRQKDKDRSSKDRLSSYLQLLKEEQEHNHNLEIRVQSLQEQKEELIRSIEAKNQQKRTRLSLFKTDNLHIKQYHDSKQSAQLQQTVLAQLSLVREDNQQVKIQNLELLQQIATLQQLCSKIRNQHRLKSNQLQHYLEDSKNKVQGYQQTIASLKSQNLSLRSINHHCHQENQQFSALLLGLGSDKKIAKSRSNADLNTKTKPSDSLQKNELEQMRFSQKRNLSQQTTHKFILRQQGMPKLVRLKNAFNHLGFQLPVSCEIDETGYLKHGSYGTYVMDREGNLFQLTTEEQRVGESENLLILK